MLPSLPCTNGDDCRLHTYTHSSAERCCRCGLGLTEAMESAQRAQDGARTRWQAEMALRERLEVRAREKGG